MIAELSAKAAEHRAQASRPCHDNLAQLCTAIASGILGFYFCAMLVAGAFFLLGFPLNRWVLPLAITGSGAALILACPSCKSALLTASILLGITLICALLAICFYDETYDGQVYHQETIIQLAEGWIPTRHELSPQQLPCDESRPLVNGLARGPEMVETAIYRWSNAIELSKMVNLMLIAAAFLLAFAALLTFDQIGTKTAACLSAIMALNPPSIYQAFSFYVDGQLASLLLCLLAQLILYMRTRQRRYLWLLMATVATVVNVKLTAIGFAGVIVTGAIAWMLFNREFAPASWTAFSAAGGLAIAVLVIGFGPYITNAVWHHHPFYPVDGPDQIAHDWRKDRPRNFNPMNRFQRLFCANFSAPENGYADPVGDEISGFTPSRLTPPLWFRPFWKLKYYAFPDMRIAGFGPYFGSAAIFAIVATVLARRRSKTVAAGAAIAAVLLFSALIHPEAWWARYCPQIWFIPGVLIAAALLSQIRWARRTALATIAILLVNIAIVLAAYVVNQTYYWNRPLRQQLRELQAEGKPLIVDFGSYRSNRVRLKEAGIDFREVQPDEALPGPAELLCGSRAMFYRE